jgi:homogentisate 1,2-dioxygenase
MAFYHKLGKFPNPKHTAFYKEDGTLFREELVSTKGFSGIYCNKYHVHAPTQTLNLKELENEENVDWKEAPLQHFHFFTDKVKSNGDFFTSRNCFLQNSHCRMYTAHPTSNPDYFYKNAYAHEYIFIHHGSGTMLSDYGKFAFVAGDQIVVPQGTIFQLMFESFDNNKILIVESDTPYEIPKHYRNEYGQCEEHAPYCERDFNLPEFMEPVWEKGNHRIVIKAKERIFEYNQPQHPYGVIGWDGYLYPFSFNIKSYHPKVGRIHLPPPVHLLFTTQHFIICNFNPRPFDWYPGAIAAPYFHSNVDSAEVLYYVEGDFMSRTGVVEGSITVHPLGIPHGPQPGKTEKSIGATHTDEYAIMVDTFEPLHPTKKAKACLDEKYWQSWLEK